MQPSLPPVSFLLISRRPYKVYNEKAVYVHRYLITKQPYAV